MPWFAVVLALMGLLACCELVLMLKLRYSSAYMLSAAVIWGLFAWSHSLVWLPLLQFVWFAIFVLSSRWEAQPFASFFAAIWMLSWIYMFAYVLAESHGRPLLSSLVVGACFAVWISDIAAYFVGRRFGQHKLCPAISPGKSLEGVLGGLLFAVPVALFYWDFFAVMEFSQALSLAMVTVLAGVLGDLSESSVKRLVGAKDSGQWLPGHGGLLDRVDAMLMAVPVTWLLWRLM